MSLQLYFIRVAGYLLDVCAGQPKRPGRSRRRPQATPCVAYAAASLPARDASEPPTASKKASNKAMHWLKRLARLGRGTPLARQPHLVPVSGCQGESHPALEISALRFREPGGQHFQADRLLQSLGKHALETPFCPQIFFKSPSLEVKARL